MINFLAIIVSICLIIIIFLRTPQDIVGLASFATNNTLFESSSSAENFLNILTAIGILVYLGIAIQLNLAST